MLKQLFISYDKEADGGFLMLRFLDGVYFNGEINNPLPFLRISTSSPGFRPSCLSNSLGIRTLP